MASVSCIYLVHVTLLVFWMVCSPLAEQNSEMLQSQVTVDERADLILRGLHGPSEITEKTGASCDLLTYLLHGAESLLSS